MSKSSPIGDLFLITDPLAQPGVVLEAPPGTKIVSIESGYVSSYEVRCSFCAKRTPHRRGFFARLPDGSMTLLGKDCAVKESDLETVSAIERDIRRREVAVAARRGVAELSIGLEPVIEILERDWLADEKEIHRLIRRLRDLFPTVGDPKMAKLNACAKGLRELMDPYGSPNLTTAKAKRSRALSMIEEGIQTLSEELGKLSIKEIQGLVKFDDPIGRYYRTRIEGRTLWKLDLPSWIDPDERAGELRMEIHMKVPEFKLADPAPLLRVIEEARSAVEGQH
jgi:hypothetical protein